MPHRIPLARKPGTTNDSVPARVFLRADDFLRLGRRGALRLAVLLADVFGDFVAGFFALLRAAAMA